MLSVLRVTIHHSPARFFTLAQRVSAWLPQIAVRASIHSSHSSVEHVNNHDQIYHNEPDGSPSDPTLMHRIASGDSQALSLLYDRYAATVLGVSLKIVRQREIAEEITQETFWRVWQRASTFDNARGNVPPWLFGIARNLSIDELRRQRARPQPAYDDPERSWMADLADESVNVETTVWLREQRDVLRAALRELSNEQREALELAYFGGLTQREIAETLGSPLGTVKTRIRLGLLKLRDILQQQSRKD